MSVSSGLIENAISRAVNALEAELMEGAEQIALAMELQTPKNKPGTTLSIPLKLILNARDSDNIVVQFTGKVDRGAWEFSTEPKLVSANQQDLPLDDDGATESGVTP